MDDVYSIYIRKLFYYFNMVGVTYSWRITSDDVSKGYGFLYTCGVPICASCSIDTSFFDYTSLVPESVAFKNSRFGASCSFYTFIATQNNTILRIESCSRMFPLNDPNYFTHSIIFQSGQIGFVCSSATPSLLVGSYSNLTISRQPGSPCDCGRDYHTTTTTVAPITPIALTQSWYSTRTCCPGSNQPFTYSNFLVSDFPTLGTPIAGKTWVQIDGANKFCWSLVNNAGYISTHRKHVETLYNNCAECFSSNPAITCPPTTTTSTTTVYQQPGPGNFWSCECGTFECVNFVIQGDVGDSVRWSECTNTVTRITNVPRAFNFYYFYEQETISICSCSNFLEVVSGFPFINGNQWPDPPGAAAPCSKRTTDCEVCRTNIVELGEEIRNSTRPVLVEYESCYAPYGGHQYPTKTMWPVSDGSLGFNGLPWPLPVWAPIPMNGLSIYGRKTHIYQICMCGNTKQPGDPSFLGPTISYWGESSWIQSQLTSGTLVSSDEHSISGACNYGTCSCFTYGGCPTTTTTFAPCNRCLVTTITATGPGYTNITYEGCDNLVRHNIKTDYLFNSNSSTICSCERCRQWRVRPLGDPNPFSYMHCCDGVFNSSGQVAPSWHSSIIDGTPITCRRFTLSSNTATTIKYIGCTGSQELFFTFDFDPVQSPCMTTFSYFSGDPVFSPTSPVFCGTQSFNICVSKHFYGDLSPDHNDFSLTPFAIPPGQFTFSLIGSCSCITSDNRYKAQPGSSNLELEYLLITYSGPTCSDKVLINPVPPRPQVPPCCDCRVYYVAGFSVGDIINYTPCDSNRLGTGAMTLVLPSANFTGTTSSASPFSVRLQATGFYGVGSFSVVVNHDKLSFVTASILQSSVTGAAIQTSGSWSRVAWQNASGTNFGSGDLVNFTFSALSSALMEFGHSSSFYQGTRISLLSGNTASFSLMNGSIKFAGINLPNSNKGANPPTFPSFP